MLMEVEDDEGAQPPGGDVVDHQPPFPVATVLQLGLNLRAYFNATGHAEWLWSRVQDFLQIESYGGKFLKVHLKALAEDMTLLEIPEGEVKYKQKGYQGTPQEPWVEHTMLSRALLTVPITCLKSKPLKPVQKERAVRLFLALGEVSLQHALSDGPMPSLPDVGHTNDEGVFTVVTLSFSKELICQEWALVLEGHKGCQQLWSKLATTEWRGRSISSPWQYATFKDICVFLLYLATNPTLRMAGRNLWLNLGLAVLPGLIFFLGACLEGYAKHLAQQKVVELPVLRTKKGFSRKHSDSMNKFLVLERVKAERLHRWRVGKTHCNLISSHCKMLKKEGYLMCVLHDAACKEAFQQQKQVSVTWDPSNYGGAEVMVSMIYSMDIDLAAYRLVQPLRKLLIAELAPELREEGRKGLLSKVEGYIEIRALSAALRNIGITLETFKPPNDLLLRALNQDEVRVKGADGAWWVVNTATQDAKLQVPPNFSFKSLPVLISISDQGPSNMAALNFLQFATEGIVCHCIYDVYHRCWNDIKLSAKKASSFPWRTILELTVVFNVPYGPFGSGAWYNRKIASMTLSHSEVWETHCFRTTWPAFAEKCKLLSHKAMGNRRSSWKAFSTSKHLVAKALWSNSCAGFLGLKVLCGTKGNCLQLAWCSSAPNHREKMKKKKRIQKHHLWTEHLMPKM